MTVVVHCCIGDQGGGGACGGDGWGTAALELVMVDGDAARWGAVAGGDCKMVFAGQQVMIMVQPAVAVARLVGAGDDSGAAAWRSVMG